LQTWPIVGHIEPFDGVAEGQEPPPPSPDEPLDEASGLP
jgi:hypothetical protein